MAERNAAVGYVALGKQSSPTTPVTPALYTPYYSTSLATDFNVASDEPVYGNRFKRFQSLKTSRKHGGSVEVMAEPNTAAYWLDMLSTKASTTGANPYTHTFGQSIATDPNSYTLDVSVGAQVIRYWGIQASKLGIGFKDGVMHFNVDVSGLGSFHAREIATVSNNTITLKTDYDSVPNLGLVVGDLVTVKKVDGSVQTNFTVSTVNADGITVVLSATAAAFAAGDMIVLRAATPSLSVLTPFVWPKSQFFFAADAATALTNSATASNQTRLDDGTAIEIMNEFTNPDGEARSGAYDPASLIRGQYDVSFKIKKFFDLPDDFKYWNALSKRACVFIAYSGSTNQYQLKVTLNNLSIIKDEVGTSSGEAIYHDLEVAPNYDTSDGAGATWAVINAVSTV